MAEEVPAPRRARPWWAPVLAAGSFGLGGLQVLAGGLLALAALAGPPEARGPFLLLGMAWLVPGILLLVAGLGLAIGRPWGRLLSLGTVAVAFACFVAVGVQRRGIPPAVAAIGEWGLGRPEAPKWAKDLYEQWRADFEKRTGEKDPMAMLRQPAQAGAIGWAYTGLCACPVVPWYLVLLFALAPPWGRRATVQGP